MRQARRDGVSHVACVGDRGEAVLGRGHHRQRKNGVSGHDGRGESGRIVGRTLHCCRRRRASRNPAFELALGGGMNWEQFRAILWLRWRLTRNQLTRGSGLGAVIAALAGVTLVLLAAGAGVGATLLGALALKEVSATDLMFVWDGVVFIVLLFSLVAILTELQRSESV